MLLRCALQTIFSPEGMDGETVYGRAAGVNWFWAVLVCGYHVALGTALFTLISLLRSDFRLSVAEIGAVLALVGLLTWAASGCQVRDTPCVPKRLPRTIRAGRTGPGFGLVWFAFHLMAFIGGGISFVWWVLAAVLVAVAAAAISGLAAGYFRARRRTSPA